MLDVICCLNVIILRSRWTLLATLATQISTLHHRKLLIICCLIQQSVELECEGNISLEGLYWVGSAFVHARQIACINLCFKAERERESMGGLICNYWKAQRKSWSWEEFMFHMYCAKLLANIEDPLWVPDHWSPTIAPTQDNCPYK